jgi:hypothetical protein
MSEDATVILITLFWATLAFAVYQRVWVIRRLHRKLDKLVDAALAPPVSAPELRPVPQDQGELSRIHKRLQVLERIAVEKEDTLAREIEELRAAGG